MNIKLTIKEVITNANSTYEEIRQALVGQGHLPFTAASEAIMTLDEGGITKVPMRQAIQKIARLFEKATAEATSIRETCLYSAMALARFFLQAEVTQYIDIKGTFDNDGFCRSIEEWQRTYPGKQTWEVRQRTCQDRQTSRVSSGKRPGECYFCGKPGHFAQECRTRLNRERQSQQITNPTNPLVTVSSSQQTRNLADVTCFKCRQKGHISPDCPKRTNRVKRIQIPEDKIVELCRNEVFGSVGPYRLPITCDMGAEVTVVSAECVEPEQLTGEECELKAFNETKTTGKW